MDSKNFLLNFLLPFLDETEVISTSTIGLICKRKVCDSCIRISTRKDILCLRKCYELSLLFL